MILQRDLVICEAIRLIELGKRVTLPVSGRSMLPFIIGGIESVELVKARNLNKGDIVLAWVNSTHFVVHRIIKIENGSVCLMGDGNLRGGERCLLSDIAAKAEYVVDVDGNRHFLYTSPRKLMAYTWLLLLPMRRWLLAIYRKICLK